MHAAPAAAAPVDLNQVVGQLQQDAILHRQQLQAALQLLNEARERERHAQLLRRARDVLDDPNSTLAQIEEVRIACAEAALDKQCLVHPRSNHTNGQCDAQKRPRVKKQGKRKFDDFDQGPGKRGRGNNKNGVHIYMSGRG